MLRYKKKIITIISVLVGVIIATPVSLAQFNFGPSADFFNYPIPGGIENVDKLTTSVSLSLDPVTPTTNEEVTVKATAFGYNSGEALHQWFLDGKAATIPLLGLNEFTFQVSSLAGDKHTVGVTVELPNGKLYSAETTITVIETIIGVEYQTLVPPRYKAAALGGNGSTVMLWALPFGLGNGREVEYRWFVNNKKIAGGVNLRKLTFNVKGGPLAPVNVRLQLINPSKNINFKKGFSFGIWNEEIVFYNSKDGQQTPNPNRSLSTGKRINPNVAGIIAWPYHFNVLNPNSLDFEWRANGRLLPRLRNHILNMSADISAGIRMLDLRVSNPNSYLERASLKAGVSNNR